MAFTKYLPLSLWDDVQLRRYTSVTEQGAELIRLVDPTYHCNSIQLAENTLCVNLASVRDVTDRDMVLLVPGASSKYKDWGKDNYLKLAAQLAKCGRKPIFIYGNNERSTSE